MSKRYLEFSASKVHCSNINCKTEMHGDKKKIRYDLSMTATIGLKVLKQLAASNKDAPDYQKTLFDSEGKPKDTGFNEYKGSSREFEDHMFVVSKPSGELAFITKSIDKFTFRPTAGEMVDLSFQVHICPHDKDAHWELQMLQLHEHDIRIERPQQMDVEEKSVQDKPEKSKVTHIAAGKPGKAKAAGKKSKTVPPGGKWSGNSAPPDQPSA